MNKSVIEELEQLIKNTPTGSTILSTDARLIKAAILRLAFAVEKQNEIMEESNRYVSGTGPRL
jgi:hypothetical protein